MLNGVLAYLAEQKFQRCGVDYETINPNANAFWTKYFVPYTYSLTRRIDERITAFRQG